MNTFQPDAFTFRTLVEASPNPVYLCIGEEMILAYANQATLATWDKSPAVIGKPILKAIPEIEQQPYHGWLLQVYRTGLTFHSGEERADLEVDGKLQTFYFKFSYQPYHDPSGEILGVFCFATDVTDLVMSRQMKEEFISLASHELKTPLTTIKAQAQLLKRELQNNESRFVVDSISRLNRKIDNLSTLVDNFVNTNTLIAGNLPLNFELFDMQDLLREVVDDHMGLFSNHTLELNDCQKVMVWADRAKICQVLENLLSNAGKYSAPGSTTTVYCKSGDKGTEIGVKDQGVGISDKEQKRLFERFYRVGNASFSTVSGFGLGLYLVAEILRQHKSVISVKSEPGKGSCFYFRLPSTSPSADLA